MTSTQIESPSPARDALRLAMKETLRLYPGHDPDEMEARK